LIVRSFNSVSGLIAVCRGIDRVNGITGKAAAWMTLFMVLVQFTLVLMRYVFGTGSLFMQESLIYAHAIVFMAAAAWTLADDRHVRVDIFYSVASPRRQAAVDLFGVIVFLLPMCWLLWWVGYPYVARSWAVLEGSRETSGIPAIFLLKTLILLFTVTLALQGIALAVRSLLVLVGSGPPPDAVPRAPSLPGDDRPRAG
jgi:TRAP-type mannitol/chloroaromatic compound transport system permease small subunit